GGQPTAHEAVTPVTTASNAITGLPALDRAAVALPSGARVSHDLGAYISDAINPDEHVCAPTTVFDPLYAEWDLWESTEPAGYDLLFNQLLADLVPQYEAIYLLTEGTPQEFGYRGQFTNALNRTHKAAKRFWDIEGEDIHLVAMKGSMLLDEERVAAFYELGVFGPVSPDLAAL